MDFERSIVDDVVVILLVMLMLLHLLLKMRIIWKVEESVQLEI
ncbi:hypothetical protein MtrunA17_Chr6g0483451 [Medicago truncatula]|uniref:Transmembrane protein n=1 Tax=Medicago truncatula TaxID=3880 RepID=A0A396HJM4_MEDTR|nr:hypothetical protein MtrunA17_Chr6g0483451 [Medicago truncatula]